MPRFPFETDFPCDVFDEVAGELRFSVQERRVVGGRIVGLSLQEIADALGLAVCTVRDYDRISRQRVRARTLRELCKVVRGAMWARRTEHERPQARPAEDELARYPFDIEFDISRFELATAEIGLSMQEKRVTCGNLARYSFREIGERLELSPRTARKYISNACAKAGVGLGRELALRIRRRIWKLALPAARTEG